MTIGKGFILAATMAGACLLGACATSGQTDSVNSAYAAATSKDAARPAPPAANGKKPTWSVPSEAEVAGALEKKYLEATKDFVKLKKNDELMFCKRYREIGSSIARINCLTVAEVRVQVDQMEQYRDDMRNRSGKCTLGAGVGAAPCSAGQ